MSVGDTDDKPIREIFLKVLDLSSATEREAYLEQACGHDAEKRAKVEALLKSHRADSFLEQPAVQVLQTAAAAGTPSEGPGTVIDKYKLLEKLGEGGFGVVYMAEQTQPVKRRVALKIIKVGMDTREVVGRFEAERQALALMDHANIAKVLDGGATETGRPYFVMELVRGTKLTDYCDEKNLPTQERLGLFIQVCQAVQHAHQKGIIHRDLKPSNILVTVNDGVAVPKIIDFGIAKATQMELSDKTVFTRFLQFLGTPAYMSPEQADLTSVDIDTRSDIYSLGVLLYELLTGKTPFDSKELLQAGLEAMRRTICEKEPVRPSTRLSTLGADELTTTAKRRSLEPPKLISLLRGDLDWIAMKCLEKDRARRYETANGLARDIERHLGNEPVVARPASAVYRFQKLVRRNRVLFAATGAFVLALVFGMGLSTWLFLRERAARKEQARLRQQAQTEKAKAQEEAGKREQVARLVEDMFTGVGPSVARGRDTTLLREILDDTASRVATELTNQPGVAMEMCHNLATAYDQLGQYKQMAEISEQELKFARACLAREDPARTTPLKDLATAYWLLRNYGQAETLHREALEILRGAPGTDPADIARSLNALALVLSDERKFAEAENAFQEVLTLLRARFGNYHSEVGTVLHNLGIVLRRKGESAKAEAVIREALDVDRKLFGDEHPEVANVLSNLALALRDQGKLGEAETACRESLDMQRKLLRDEHPVQIASSLVCLASVLSDERKLADAEMCYREALARLERLGIEHPLTRDTWLFLVSTLGKEGKLAEAEQLCSDRLPDLRARLPADDPGLVDALQKFADILLTDGKFTEAEARAHEALAICEKTAPDDWRMFAMRRLVGTSLLGQKKYAEAEPLLLSGYRGMKERESKIQRQEKLLLKVALQSLVQLYDATGRPEQVAEWKKKLDEFEQSQTNKN
jgi:serine/threonine protein kinase/tetratricopeptide (TPR) repeat protein